MPDFVIDTGVKKRLADPDAVLRQIGAMLLGSAQKAFREQRLGSTKWVRRYPKQRPPLLNIAGALSDFRNGAKKPKAHRYQGRPVGKDTGRLLLSLAKNKPGALTIGGQSTVTVGSVVPYASVMQWGGYSTQPVTAAAKKRMAKWMSDLRGDRRKKASYNPSTRTWGPKKPGKGKKSGKAKKSTKGSGRASKTKSGKTGTPKRGRGGGASFKMPKTSLSGPAKKTLVRTSVEIQRAQKMAFLFHRSQLKTKVIARPFLGITPESARKIKAIVEKGIQHGTR